jgi:hypothetical protein
MGPFDLVALAFATYMVSLALIDEGKDIRLVSIAVEQAGDRLSRNMHRAVVFLNGIRWWVFMPSLLSAVPTLVLVKGGERAFYPTLVKMH